MSQSLAFGHIISARSHGDVVILSVYLQGNDFLNKFFHIAFFLSIKVIFESKATFLWTFVIFYQKAEEYRNHCASNKDVPYKGITSCCINYPSYNDRHNQACHLE